MELSNFEGLFDSLNKSRPIVYGSDLNDFILIEHAHLVLEIHSHDF